MWVDFPEQTKEVNVSVSQVNAHQKVVSAEEDFDNQVDRMTHPVNTN